MHSKIRTINRLCAKNQESFDDIWEPNHQVKLHRILHDRYTELMGLPVN